MLDRLRFEREIELLSEAPKTAYAPTPQPPPARQPAPAKPAGTNCTERMKATRVAVIGGGLAGLMTALKLGEQGAKVTLYEARAKVGGRVSTRKISGNRIIEEGAELIGSFHTSWLDLARKYKLDVITRKEAEEYDHQGLKLKQTLDQAELSNEKYFELSDKLNGILEAIAKTARGLTFDAHAPWDAKADLAKLKGFDGRSVANALETDYQVVRYEPGSNRTRTTLLWRMIEHLMINDEVAQLDDMNFLGLICKVKAGQGPRLARRPTDEKEQLMGYWEELEIFRSADGCETLAQKMLADMKSRLKVNVQTLRAVLTLGISSDGVLVGSRKMTAKGKVEDDDVPLFVPYDYVVLTAPPTVWGNISVSSGGIFDKGKTKITGGKSRDLKAEIGIMASGPAIKHFTLTKDRFWMNETPPAAPYGGTPRLGQIWEETDNQIKVDGQKSILAVFAGPLLKDGTMFRAPNEKECVAELKHVYTKYPTKPESIFIDWPNMPFIRTGYASPSKGQVMTVGRKLTTAFEGRLLFAGEHTHMGCFGYMEGALRSGERAAELLQQLTCQISTDARTNGAMVA